MDWPFFFGKSCLSGGFKILSACFVHVCRQGLERNDRGQLCFHGLARNWKVLYPWAFCCAQLVRELGYKGSLKGLHTFKYKSLEQWFPTGGTRTPRGTQAHCRGYVETFNNHLCYVILFENHQHGGTHGMTNRLRGYTRQKRLGNTGLEYRTLLFLKLLNLGERVWLTYPFPFHPLLWWIWPLFNRVQQDQAERIIKPFTLL